MPDHFDPVIDADRLRCAGVVEAVRVSRVGYPQRYTHSLFLARCRLLGQKEMKLAARASRRLKPADVLVQAIAQKILLLESDSKKQSTEESKSNRAKDRSNSLRNENLISVGIQVGKTKVFLRR